MDIEAYLHEAIVKFADVPASQVTNATTLAELQLDSLTVAEILVELEIQLDRELPLDVLRRLDDVETVGDVADELRAALDGTTGDATAGAPPRS